MYYVLQYIVIEVLHSLRMFSFVHILDSFFCLYSVDCHLITSTQLQSEYSYVGASMFSTWAGLLHWKFKRHSSKDERGDNVICTYLLTVTQCSCKYSVISDI